MAQEAESHYLSSRVGFIPSTGVPTSDEGTGQTTCSVATTYLIAASTMAMSCSVVPPLTPTPAISWPSLVNGTPPPVAVYLPTAARPPAAGPTGIGRGNTPADFVEFRRATSRATRRRTCDLAAPRA